MHPSLRSGRVLFALAALLSASLFMLRPGFAGGEKKVDVDTMDLDLLHESLLKIWIIEEASGQHNQRRIAQQSFDALTAGGESTGDAEKDAAMAASRKDLDKKLRHYLLLELDGAIESVDLVDRVLGTKVTLNALDAEKRRYLMQGMPEIKWNNMSLDQAFEDLSRMTHSKLTFPKLPKTLQLEISYETSAGIPLLSVLQFINSEHPIEWTWVDGGGLDVRYLGEITPPRGGR